jgi:hypothetical protein
MKQLLCIGFLVIWVSLCAQPKLDDYDIELGPFFKVSKRSVPVSFIGNDPSGFYMVYAKGKTGAGEMSLNKFGYNLLLEKELSLSQTINGEIFYPSVIFMMEGQLFQFSQATTYDSKKIYLQSIDKQQWKLGKGREVAVIESEGRSAFNATSRVYFSSDSSHLALVYAIPNKRKENESFGVHIFDKKLNEVWNQRFELLYTNKLLDLTTFKVSNKGELLVLGRRFYDKRKLKSDGETNYDYLLFDFDKTGTIDSFQISSEGKYLKDMQIQLTPSGDLICAGFYSDNSSNSVKGAYYLRADRESKQIVKSSFKEFEDGFLLENLTERQAKKVQDKLDRGKDVELPFFHIDDFLVDQHGNTRIIAEQRHIYIVTVYTQYGAISNTHYDYSDVMILDLNKEGEFVNTSRIAKNQHTVNDAAAYSSYSSAVNERNTYLVFNDNALNVDYDGVGRIEPMRKNSSTMVMIARVGQDGKIVRDALFDRGDIETKVRPALCTQLNEDEMLLFGHKGLKTQRFILLKFK